MKVNLKMKLPQTIKKLFDYWKNIRRRNKAFYKAFYAKTGKADPDYAFAIPAAFMFLIVLTLLSGAL